MRLSSFTMLALLALALVLALTGCDIIKASQVESAVNDALNSNPETSQLDLDITYQDSGEILVTGEVWNAALIDKVTEVISGVEGVSGVINRCAVPEEDSGLILDVPTGSLAF